MADSRASRYPHFVAETSAEVVIARIGDDVDPRLREIMSAVIRHAHALVKEVRLTPDEWLAASSLPI
jgi:catechol 1,2-dioxygenase